MVKAKMINKFRYRKPQQPASKLKVSEKPKVEEQKGVLDEETRNGLKVSVLCLRAMTREQKVKSLLSRGGSVRRNLLGDASERTSARWTWFW